MKYNKSSKILLLLFIGISIIVSVCATTSTTYKRCITPSPESQNGWCVPVSKCKIVADISNISLDQFPVDKKNFIINSICPDEMRFCCSLLHINPTFIKTNGLNASHSTTEAEITNLETTISEIPAIRNISSPSTFNLSNQTNLILDIDTHPNINLLPKVCGEGGDDDRVSNGEIAELTDFPFMALLQYRTPAGNTFGCAGTLINSRYILTAAHCFKTTSTFKLFSARLGEHNTATEKDCDIGVDEDDTFCNDAVQDIPIEKIIAHEKFNARSGANDIALLRLQNPANVSVNNVRFICLPTTFALRNTVIKIAEIAGWGATENGKISNLLLKGVVAVNNDRPKCIEKYAAQYKIRISDAHICATGENKVDTCKGDSGGPLFAKMKFENILIGKYVQLGVVSAGPKIKCGELNDFGGSLYTSISKHMLWILNNLEPY